MKWDAFLLALILTINLQVFPFSQLTVMGLFPNLLFALLVFSALYLPLHTTLYAAFATGLALDLFSGYEYHLHTALFLAFGALINSLRDVLFKDHFFTQFTIAAVCMALYQSLYISLIHFLYLPELPLIQRMLDVPIIALYTASVTPTFIWCAKRYCRLWKIQLQKPIGAGS